MSSYSNLALAKIEKAKGGAYWPFDSFNGITDVSGNGHHLSSSGNPNVGAYTPSPIFGENSATLFDDVDDFFNARTPTVNGSETWPTRRNLVLNPSFETDVANWGQDPDGGSMTLTRSSNWSYAGEYSMRAQGTLGAGTYSLLDGTGVAVTANSWYTLSAHLRIDDSVSVGFELELVWFNGAAYISETESRRVATPGEHFLYITDKAPGTATAVAVRVRWDGTNGETYDFYSDGWMLEAGRTLGVFFNGNGYINSPDPWAGRENLCSNPSFEFGTGDWAGNLGSGETVSRSGDAVFGKYSGAVTCTGASAFQGIVGGGGGITQGKTYTSSVWIKATAGRTITLQPNDGAGYSASVTATGEWQKITKTWTATGGGGSVTHQIFNPNATSMVMLVDGMLCEEGTEARPYIDGTGYVGKVPDRSASDNIITNSTFESDLSGWASPGVNLNSGATLTRVTSQKRNGVASMQVVTTAALSAQGASFALGAQFTIEHTYTASMWLKGNAGGETVEVFFGNTGIADYGQKQVTLTTGWQKVDVTWTPTVGGANQQALTVRTQTAAVHTWFVDDVSAQEVPKTVDPDGAWITVDRAGPWVSDPGGYAGWTGTAGASASHAGPFADGTKRTFFGWAKRLGHGTDQLIASTGSGASQQQFRLTTGDDFVAQPAGSGGVTFTWTDAWLDNTTWHFWAFTMDSLNDTVEFFMDGKSLGAQQGAWTAPLDSTLKVGARATSSDIFNGPMAGVGVVNALLTAQEIMDLYSSALGPQQRVRQRRQVPALHARYRFWDGRYQHVGPEDKPDQGRITDVSFNTELNGGHAAGDVKVSNPGPWSKSDSILMAEQKLTDDEGRNVHEGRVVGAPRTGTDEVTIQTEGYVKALGDDKSCAEILRDIDPQKWISASIAFRAVLGSFNVSQGEPTVGPGPDGTPKLITEYDAPWSGGNLQIWATYDAGAARVGSMWSECLPIENIGSGDTNWQARRRFASVDVGNDEETTNQIGTGHTNTLTAGGTNRRFAWIAMQYAATNTGGSAHHECHWKIALYGYNKLTKRGSEPNAGFYVSDIVPFLVDKYASVLKTTPDSIEQTSFIVPHFVLNDPESTVLTGLDQLVVFGGNVNRPLDYFVYDDKVLNVKSPGQYGRKWRLRKDMGVEPSDQGSDAADQINGVIIAFDPGDGTKLTAGPTGSRCEFETDQLQITDPNHPWTRASLRNWDMFDAGVMSPAAAILVGQLILAERNTRQWRGTITVKGMVRELGGAEHPPYMIRAGDQFVLEDDDDTRERRVISTSYDGRARSVSCAVGAPPDRLDVLLARAGVVLVGKV